MLLHLLMVSGPLRGGRSKEWKYITDVQSSISKMPFQGKYGKMLAEIFNPSRFQLSSESP